MSTLASTPTLRKKASFMAGGNGVSGYECIGIHRGAIDTTTVSTKPPPVIMNTVRQVLDDLGIQVQEQSTYSYRCIRATREDDPVDTDATQKGIYGSPTEDPGDEVRLSIELTRLEGLNDTYSLDIRRLKGNLRSYKFLYDTIREKAALST